jgi:cytochrome c
MDSFELNKIAGAVLGVLTFTLGLNVFTDIAWTPHELEKPGFVIEVPEGGSGAAQAAAPADVPIANLLAAASVEKGEAQAKKCAACHNFVEGAGAKVGPDLYGVVGRPVASAEGFSYSAAMKGHGGNWTFQDLADFIKNPKADVPGTSMGFAGLAKETDRADLIAYLNTLSHNPLPLPAPEATPAAAPAGDAPPAPQGANTPSGDTPAQANPAPGGTEQTAPAPAAPASGAANPGEGAAPTQAPAEAQPAPTQPAPGQPGGQENAPAAPAPSEPAAPATPAPAQ